MPTPGRIDAGLPRSILSPGRTVNARSNVRATTRNRSHLHKLNVIEHMPSISQQVQATGASCSGIRRLCEAQPCTCIYEQLSLSSALPCEFSQQQLYSSRHVAVSLWCSQLKSRQGRKQSDPQHASKCFARRCATMTYLDSGCLSMNSISLTAATCSCSPPHLPLISPSLSRALETVMPYWPQAHLEHKTVTSQNVCKAGKALVA